MEDLVGSNNRLYYAAADLKIIEVEKELRKGDANINATFKYERGYQNTPLEAALSCTKALDKNKKKQYKRSELQNYNVSRTAVTEPSGLVLEMRMDESGKKRYYIQAIIQDSWWFSNNEK